MEEKACCCAPGRKTNRQDCAICGKPLVYFSDEKQMECAICHNDHRIARTIDDSIVLAAKRLVLPQMIL